MPGKAEELRGEIKAILKKRPNNKPNISKEEYQALKEIKNDNTRMVLTADKGVSMVVIDKEEYIKKSEVITVINIRDPNNRSHNQTQEQSNIPAQIHQGRRWD